MNTNDAKSVDSQLLELQKSYLAKLDRKLEEILAIWSSGKAQTYSKDTSHKLYRAVHAVAGTSAILNITDVSRVCSSIQDILHPIINTNKNESCDLSILEKPFNELKTIHDTQAFGAKPIKLNE